MSWGHRDGLSKKQKWEQTPAKRARCRALPTMLRRSADQQVSNGFSAGGNKRGGKFPRPLGIEGFNQVVARG
jgi:hypothetical protein